MTAAAARPICLANIYLARVRAQIPAAGERAPLVELRSHCRGAIFLDGARLETTGLHAAFCFGRVDIRQRRPRTCGDDRFEVLEWNGVYAEAPTSTILR